MIDIINFLKGENKSNFIDSRFMKVKNLNQIYMREKSKAAYDELQ